MPELIQMIHNVCPLQWKHMKWIELLLVVFIWVAVFDLTARRGTWTWRAKRFMAPLTSALAALPVSFVDKRLRAHVVLQVLAWIGFLYVFTAGALERGVTGTMGESHGFLWYVPLSVHIAAGAVYILGVPWLLFRTGVPLRRGTRGIEADKVDSHRRVGRLLAWAGLFILVFGLPY